MWREAWSCRHRICGLLRTRAAPGSRVDGGAAMPPKKWSGTPLDGGGWEGVCRGVPGIADKLIPLPETSRILPPSIPARAACRRQWRGGPGVWKSHPCGSKSWMRACERWARMSVNGRKPDAPGRRSSLFFVPQGRKPSRGPPACIRRPDGRPVVRAEKTLAKNVEVVPPRSSPGQMAAKRAARPLGETNA